MSNYRQLEIDFTDALVEEGWHEVAIADASVRQAKNEAGEEYINTKYRNLKGRFLYDRMSLHPNSRKRLQRFFAIIGLPHTGKVTISIPNDIVDKKLRVLVGHVKTDDGSMEESITSFEAIK